MLHLDDLAIFVSIVEQKSFTGAAKKLDMPKATLSRRFADFEKRIEKQLLTRSTRTLTLTEEGRRLYEVAAQNVHQGLVVQNTLLSKESKIKGSLNLCCSSAIAEGLLLPRLHQFNDSYPDIDLNLHISEQSPDMVSDEMDIHIRLGNVKDGDYVFKPLSKVRQWLVAAPSYLSRSPKVNQPSDLEKLNALVQHRSQKTLQIGKQTIKLNSRYVVDSLSTLLAMTKQGHGYAWLPDFLVQNDVKDAKLFCLFPQYPFAPTEIFMVTQKRKFRTPQSQALIEFLEANVPQRHLLRLAG